MDMAYKDKLHFASSPKINKQPTSPNLISISKIDSFVSVDDARITTPKAVNPLQTNLLSALHLPRSNTTSRSVYAKHKLQRVISRRFGKAGPLIKKALSQFLTDEEFDAPAMTTDFNDPDGYIMNHLTDKFGWGVNTRRQFFIAATDALNEERQTETAHGIIPPNYDTQRSECVASLNFSDLNEKEEEKDDLFNATLPDSPQQTERSQRTDNALSIASHLSPDTETTLSLKYGATAVSATETVQSTPVTATLSLKSGVFSLRTDDNDDTEPTLPYTHMDTDAWTDGIIQKKKTRYPEYVIKAIFYAADDEHVEVLLDQAINFIANDSRFNYLWHDEDFLAAVYRDKKYNFAVERLMREIQDIAQNDDGADFFHQFVYREYDRERKDYLRGLLTASKNKSYRDKARANDKQRNNKLYDTAIPSDKMERLGSRTQSISESTVRSKYTIKYKETERDGQHEFDIRFKIRAYKLGDDKKYINSKSECFQLPNCAPGSKFMWAQYRSKKIQRFRRRKQSHGYWKLLKCQAPAGDNNGDTAISMHNGRHTEMSELTTISEKKRSRNNKTDKKGPAVPVLHLNLILGLMRFYLKQKKLDKDKTWIWNKCDKAFSFKDKDEKHKDDRLTDKKDIAVEIGDIEYKISWYNGGDGFDDCVAFAIRKQTDFKKFHFYLCFKAEIEDKIEWQWYNNDESYFQKYELGFFVFAQLEASFQANLHTNFPFNILPSASSHNKIRESPFNMPCIPEMNKAMKKPAQHYIVRYLFTKSKRIQDMEQLSVNKNKNLPEYARRIKRMIAGTNQSTLFAYFLKTSDFVDEWKERFLLSEETQVYFFWSFILAIATTMKYMELELENQFITFSFRRGMNDKRETGCMPKLDTSDLRREIRDLDLFAGFIVPPLQIMQTQDVDASVEESHVKAVDWYRRLSTVGILEKQIHYDNFDTLHGCTLHDKPSDKRVKKNEQYDTCPHDFHRDQYPWKGKLGTLYCDRCAHMMRFGEYLRKFCLEYENRELIQFLWPWHKNTFHMKDRQKYHEAITRQNFNFLFDSEDLLRYVPRESNKELIAEFEADMDEQYDLEAELRKTRSFAADQVIQNRKKVFEAHIRHKRKYSARFMLGAWESLKNLNIIKVQMGAVFEQLEVDRVHAEVAAAAKESIEVKFCQHKINALIEMKQKILNQRKLSHDLKGIITEDVADGVAAEPVELMFEAKQWQLEPKDWPKWLRKWNTKLLKRLLNNHWLMILKLNKFKILDIATMSPKQLPNWDSFLTWALSPAYKLGADFANESSDESDPNESDSDQEVDNESSALTDSDNEYKANSPAKLGNADKLKYAKTEATSSKERLQEWKKQFSQSWTRVPSWWHIGHDKVLIELAVQNQFNERKYYNLLTKRAAYFRMRLNESIGEQDYTQDVAFQEFKNWCIRWENIMHRVRYISAIVARQISSITPSIIEILIEDKKDRPTWQCQSLVFLNDNQRDTHIQRITELPKPAGWNQTIKDKKQLEIDEEELDSQSSVSYVDEPEPEFERLMIDEYQKAKSKRRVFPKFVLPKTKTQFIEEEKMNNMVDNKIDWRQLFKECRTRDPFMIRDLGFELKEILNTFDLVTYGEPMSKFVIELLRTRGGLRSLWTFLGVLLKTMPNKESLKILYNNRTQLRRAKPSDLDWICRQVIQGTRFIVPACLFLSHFMKENARDDLARNGVWEGYSKKYEEYAAEQVSSIEDDFMLTMLMNIPVYMKEISLIQLALEQHNTLFLNTERVNRMVTHTWFTANPLNPHIEMLSHTKNPKRNLRDAFKILLRKPIYFYLTPFGHQWCISLFFTCYVICIIVWIALNSSARHNLHQQVYKTSMGWFERCIWFMNLGFVFAEFMQFYTLGRAYFSVDGATNLWDIIISIIWCVLAGIRFWFIVGFEDHTHNYLPPESSFFRRRLRANDDILCPPDFFSCKVVYNESCIAEVSSKENEIIDLLCDYNEMMESERRSLQDSNVDSFSGHDMFYEETVTAASESNVDSKTGLKCVAKNFTIPYDGSLTLDGSNDTIEYFWNETCLNYNDDLNTTDTDCLLVNEVCVETFDSQLLLVYNVLWATQIAMLTMRLLSYFESAGGFFGILLRVVRAMIMEVLKFGVIIIIVTTGFLFAIWYLFSSDIDTEQATSFTDLYDVVIFFFKLLFGGGNVGTIDTFYQNYRVYAQLLTMVFAILGVRMFMSLLIALMSGAMNSVRQKAKAETSFTSALYAHELSISPRVMPMPLNVVVVIIGLICHILNFMPAMISPEHLNIYAYVNQKRLYGSNCCNKSSHKHEIVSINHMNTRRRVFAYYILSILPYKMNHDWRIYHVGCYNTITGIYGNGEIQAVSTNEYYSILESRRKHSEENRKLNVYDKLFIKHLTLKTLFCKFCFRPITLEDMRRNLLTPFQAMTNIISCYTFLVIWPFFIPFFWVLCQIEKLIQYWTEELRAHSPNFLFCRQREYDLEYFPRSAVKPLSVRNKTQKDFRRLGTGGPDVTDVDVNYDEMDDAGE